jgi:CheY-like chemotaxis protein
VGGCAFVRRYAVSKNPRPAAISEQELKPPSEQELKASQRIAVRRRVLVVEDDIDSARSLTWILRDLGHEVDYAINGYVAVDMAAQLRPEFVFLDLALPGLNGFEVCQRLRRLPGFEATRIIAITAYSQDEYRKRAHDAGCNGYIVKPLDPMAIDALLD